jgi:carbamoyl-phosphate synthase large subunit
VDASDEVAGRYFSDAFYRVPPAGDSAFVHALLEVCRRHQADLLVPIVDYEFAPISRNAARFRAAGCLVAISPPETIARVNNKLETYRFFLEHGFPTAQSWDAAAARRSVDSLPYPVFLKPALDGRSSIDCYTVKDAADLEMYLDKVPDAMVQEFVSGPEFTADILADWNSDVLGVVVRERIETKGGVSYKGRTVDDPEMTAHVVRMAKLLDLKGPVNIQAFRSGAGLVFNEINPRFSGALALSLAAGLNSPLLLLKLALGIPVEPAVGNTRIGVTMLRFWDEVFVGSDGRPEYPDYHLAPEVAMAGGW